LCTKQTDINKFVDQKTKQQMQNIYNIIVHLNKTVDKINRNAVKWQILFIQSNNVYSDDIII